MPVHIGAVRLSTSTSQRLFTPLAHGVFPAKVVSHVEVSEMLVSVMVLVAAKVGAAGVVTNALRYLGRQNEAETA